MGSVPPFADHELVLSPIKDTHNWIVTQTCRVRIRGGYIKIPKGTVTDFATIRPRFIWIFIAPTDPVIREASVIHDYLYSDKTPHIMSSAYSGHMVLTRSLADKIFYDYLVDNGFSKVMARIAYCIIRLIGKRHIEWVN